MPTPSRKAVIIGGGITGTLTCLELQSAGWDVTLIEKSHIGSGSSSRTAAGIRQQFSTPETILGMRYSVQYYQAFSERIQQPVIFQNGYLFVYDNPEALEQAFQRVELQKKLGLTEVEALKAPQLQERFSWLNQELIGGTFCPTDGFLLPEVIYQESVQLAQAQGARFIQHAMVTGSKTKNGQIVELETSKGPVSGDLFFDCTNAWSTRTGELLGATHLPVAPLKRYLWFLSRTDSFPKEVFQKMPLVINPKGVYCRPENSDTLMMGHAQATTPDWDFSNEDQDEIKPEWSHQADFEDFPYQSWISLANTIPALEEFVGLFASSSGYYGTTPDHNPFLGYDLQLSNLIRLVGFSGHGAMFGPFSAKVAVSLAEAGTPLEFIEVLGHWVSLAAFSLGREFDQEESLVI